MKLIALTVLILYSASVQADMVINELNCNDPTKLETQEFIEIKMLSTKTITDKSLDGWSIIVIEYDTKGDE